MGSPADATRARRRFLAAVAAAVAGVLASLTMSAASYTDVTGAAASFGSAACYYRATVQSGRATSTADGITAATITAVDPSRAFLMFSTRHDSNRPVASEIGGRIASATTLEFYRDTNEASPVPMTIEWSVVEYPCGVTVQRGSVVQTGTTLDVTIAAVASTAQAFVLWSKNVHELDQAWDQNDPVVGDLTSTTNLQFRSDALNVNHTIWWQVVAFADASMIQVQRGTTALTGGVTSIDVTTPAAFGKNTSFLLVDTRQPTTVDMASSLVRGRLIGTSTVTIDRSAGTYDVTEVGWQVVDLRDGSSVQASSASFSSGSTIGNAVLSTAVDPARTNVFASTQTGGGQNGGRTTYNSDDVVGAAAFALRLTSTTNVEIVRDFSAVSGASANVSIFTVSWGLP